MTLFNSNPASSCSRTLRVPGIATVVRKRKDSYVTMLLKCPKVVKCLQTDNSLMSDSRCRCRHIHEQQLLVYIPSDCSDSKAWPGPDKVVHPVPHLRRRPTAGDRFKTQCHICVGITISALDSCTTLTCFENRSDDDQRHYCLAAIQFSSRIHSGRGLEHGWKSR